MRVCAPTGPPTPPPPARRVGAALKGLGAGLRRLGIRAEERGWGRGAECCRVSHVRPTYSPAPTGSRAAGPWGHQEPPLAGGGGLGAQTTPPRLPSLLRAFVWWDRLGRSPNPVLGPKGELGSPTGGRDGDLGWPLDRSVSVWVYLTPSPPLCAPPSDPTSRPLLCRGCFPLPVFFPALAPPRAAWSGGSGGAPQEAGCALSLPPPLPSNPHNPLKKVWAVM